MIRVTLPKPPSINHIYGYTSRGGFARSYITKKGSEWFNKASIILSSISPIDPPYTLTIYLFTARRQDLDNIVKPIQDALQKNSIISNDSDIIELHVKKEKSSVSDERVEISLTQIY